MKEESSIRRKRQLLSSAEISLYEHGKLPPQAIDLEEAVLGAIMLEKDALMQIIDILLPEMFYKDAHQKIFKAILELFNKGDAVDILTVTQQLKHTGELELIGGAYNITLLTSRIASSANIGEHIAIVIDKFVKRELIRIGSNTINDAFEDTSDSYEVMEKTEREMLNLSERQYGGVINTYQQSAKKQLDKIRKILSGELKMTGVPSGFTELDRITHGWQQGNLIIIAARPGMGKTTLALNCLLNLCTQFNGSGILFSLEMTVEELTVKLLSIESKINVTAIRNVTLEEYQLDEVITASNYASNKLYIDDTGSINVMQLRAKIMRLVMHENIKLVVIDYIQLMSSTLKGTNREQVVSDISRNLKIIAKDLKIPIIAISQLSREVEKRGGDKRPILSDLRESGAIEQDADLVIFLYRPEYYKMDCIEFNHAEYSSKEVCEVIIAKHRNGITKSCLLKFKGNISKFEDYEDFTPIEEIKDDKPF